MLGQYDVELLNSSTIDLQIQVYMESFKKKDSIDELKNKWIAKHYNNPFHDSYIFGAFDDGKLVAINAFMPLEYYYDGRIIKVVESCESGTLPSHRGKGIWSKIINYAMDYFRKEGQYDFIIGFPNYKNSYFGFKKLGWNHVTNMKNYILVVNGSTLLEGTRFERIPGKSFIGTVQQLPVKVFANKKLKNDNIFGNINNDEKKGFSINITDEFMEWKQFYYCMQQIVIYDEKETPVADCCYSIRTYQGKRVAYILSMSTTESNKKVAYAKCIKKLIERHKDIAFIRLWFEHSCTKDKIFKELGFIRSRHKNPFVVFKLSNQISSDQLQNSDNWKELSFMDLD